MGAGFWVNWRGGEWNCIREWWQCRSVNCKIVSESDGSVAVSTVKLYQRVMAVSQCRLSNCIREWWQCRSVNCQIVSIFYHSFFFSFLSCPTLILLFFAPKWHQLWVVTRLAQNYLVQKVLNLYIVVTDMGLRSAHALFQVYMYSVWYGWFLPLLFTCLTFRLAINYLRYR